MDPEPQPGKETRGSEPAPGSEPAAATAATPPAEDGGGNAPTPEEVARLKARLPKGEREGLERDLEDVARGDQWAW